MKNQWIWGRASHYGIQSPICTKCKSAVPIAYMDNHVCHLFDMTNMTPDLKVCAELLIKEDWTDISPEEIAYAATQLAKHYLSQNNL